MIYALRQLYDWNVQREIRPGVWMPARPERGPWRFRLRAAWEVFRGRADAFLWPEDEPATGEQPHE